MMVFAQPESRGPSDPTQNGGRLHCALTCRSHGPVLIGVWLATQLRQFQ